MVLEMYNDEVIDFGIFECDKPSNIKMIAKSIKEFEFSTLEKTRYNFRYCTLYIKSISEI